MNLVDYLDRGARIAPDAPCLVSAHGEVLMSHAEFQAMTRQVAVALRTDGVNPGDRVAVLSPNDPLALVSVVGIIRAGAVWTAVNAGGGINETVDFLDLTGCSCLIYHPTLAEKVPALLERLPTIETVVALGPGRSQDPVFHAWLPPAGDVEPEALPSTDDVAALAGTGGTTGRSKAVPLTHRQIVLMSVALNAHLSSDEKPTYICATPMTHAAGVLAFPVLSMGGSVVIHQGVHPEELLNSIQTNKASRLFLPPTALYALLAHPRVREFDYSSLRHFIVGAAPVAPQRLAEAVDVFGPVMTQAFGQTEAPVICTLLTPEQILDASNSSELGRWLTSCGRQSLVARVEIMDEDGNLLGPEEPGEIVIRSGLVFDGYWNDDDASAETRRPGGWHGTGDIGLRDKDGFIYIIDRKKDMIVSGGFNVFPSQIESVIHTVADVGDCAVIGVPDDKWGEAVTAVIEPIPGRTVDVDAVLAICKEQLGPVKTPKSVLIRVLPRSANGKVLKRVLRDEFWADSARKV